MDRCLKDKAHFIIAQTIWNNKNGKAVFAEQVFDRCQRKFQDEINRELYKLIEEGGGGGTGKDGKTPVMQIGNVTTVDAGEAATANVRQDGTDVSGNPIYKIDFGIPRGANGANGDDGIDGKTPVFETGEVVTGAAGTAAIVEVVINGVDETGNPKYLINFTIPRGADGIGSGGGTDRGRCIFTLEDYSAAYRPEIGLSKILPAIGGFALNDCIIDVTGSVRQVTAVSEDKQTANLSDAIYTFPTGGGTGGVTETRVTEMINAVVGDINTILDNINGEVV